MLARDRRPRPEAWDGYILGTQDAAALDPRTDQGLNPTASPAAPQLNTQRTPASLAIRLETVLPVISPAGNPPPGEIHWPTM